MILCIETATITCSVALCNPDGTVSVRESDEDRSHASQLTLFIGELLEEVSLKSHQLEAIVISKGPGSYTGLRIGVSVAKGIAYASGIPLVAINTLESMCYGIIPLINTIRGIDDKTLLCPMLDARRMEVYYSFYNDRAIGKTPTRAEIIDSGSFSDLLSGQKIVFFGNGSQKCMEVIKNRNAVFFKDFKISAKHLCSPGYDAIKRGQFEDVAYFEPFYLKDFIATVPKKNIPGS